MSDNRNTNWGGSRPNSGRKAELTPRELAERRVNKSAQLQAHRDVILDYDWPEGDEHWRWVANASVRELLAWAKGIKAVQSPGITVVEKSIEKKNVNIKTLYGTIEHAYVLIIKIEYQGKCVEFIAESPLITDKQNEDWCRELCERRVIEIPDELTAGQVHKLAHSYTPLKQLGFPTPPEGPPLAKMEYLLELANKTGLPGIKAYNQNYLEWVRQYNAWIDAHPYLAREYGCNRQKPDWTPFQD